MPNPKRRHSKARRDKRRAHDHLTAPGLSLCPNCHEPKLAHRVCPRCGHYKGKQVIGVEEV
jgi:large subunit ribosomal protein L32